MLKDQSYTVVTDIQVTLDGAVHNSTVTKPITSCDSYIAIRNSDGTVRYCKNFIHCEVSEKEIKEDLFKLFKCIMQGHLLDAEKLTANNARKMSLNENKDFIQSCISTVDEHIEYRAKCGYNTTIDLEFETKVCEELKKEYGSRGFQCKIEHYKQSPNRSSLYISW